MLCTESDALTGYVTAPSTRLSFDPVRSAVRIELALALRQFDKQRSLLNLNRVRRARLHWLAFSPNGEDRLASTSFASPAVTIARLSLSDSAWRACRA